MPDVSIMNPLVTIVIPVLSDAAALSRLLPEIPDTPDLEVVVASGDADPRLSAVISSHARSQLVQVPPGRGRQMNAGAERASGEWILFLHADSRLPDGWLSGISGVDSSVDAGWFRFALDDEAWQARVIERLVSWRVRWLKLPYGDQGFFVRRKVYRSLGGFPEWPLLEDVAFARRLAQHGRVSELPLALKTSSRRWRRDGWWRRSTMNLLIVTLYFAGVSPARLARWYDPRPG